MIDKNEIICLKCTGKGPFFEEYLVCVQSESAKTTYFNLRAMKKSLITLNVNDEELVMHELRIRTKLRHLFLVNQVCAFQDYDNLYYVSKYAPAKLLNSKILPKKFSVEISKFYIAEIFMCLRYLHSKGQNYTYLCPENVFLGADGHIKLDYSFCNCIEYWDNGIVDNIEYVSLDYIKNNIFSYLSDYWSMGVVLYRMVFGYTPFTGKGLDNTISKIRECDPYIPETCGKPLADFIRLLLNRNLFSLRPSCEALEETMMRHPFFKSINWKLVEKRSIEPPFLIKIPKYDIEVAPGLNRLYTSDFIVGTKDGYGKIFRDYNTIHFLREQ